MVGAISVTIERMYSLCKQIFMKLLRLLIWRLKIIAQHCLDVSCQVPCWNGDFRNSLLRCNVVLNPLTGTGNYSATSNNVKLVHWPFMGALLHLYSEEGPSPPRPLLAVPNVTAHPSTASVPITVRCSAVLMCPLTSNMEIVNYCPTLFGCELPSRNGDFRNSLLRCNVVLNVFLCFMRLIKLLLC